MTGQRGKIRRDPFLSPWASIDNMDLYLIRSGILNALYEYKSRFHGTVLDVGCGQSPYKGWLLSENKNVVRYIGLDQENNPIHDNQPDLCWTGTVMPVEDKSVDCVLCTEVLEHCPDPGNVLREIQRVLAPDGFLFVTTPFVWPLHEVPFDEYRYTPFALDRLLRDAGFGEIEIRPLGGWDASFAQMIGLWARRRSPGRWARVLRSVALYPLYLILILTDKQRKWEFEAGIMFTGLAGTARKSRHRVPRGTPSES